MIIIFYGDLVEFNKYEVKETILGEIDTRFNTKIEETPVILITLIH
jgi:hypothetical protein